MGKRGPRPFTDEERQARGLPPRKPRKWPPPKATGPQPIVPKSVRPGAETAAFLAAKLRALAEPVPTTADDVVIGGEGSPLGWLARR